MILKKRDNTFWKRFSLSFTLILVLPIAFFTLLFLKNYRRLYQDEVLKQAQNVLDGTMNELDKELENLQNIVSYNSLLAHVKSSAVIKDVTGKEIIKTLAAETATHPILEDIEYYNEERPEQLFTAKGLYSLKFYVPLWMGETEESAYIEQFEGIVKFGWIVQCEEGYGIKRLQYVKDENTEETKSSETTAASAATTATGDNFRPGLWVILVGVACLALAALFLFKKKA